MGAYTDHEQQGYGGEWTTLCMSACTENVELMHMGCQMVAEPMHPHGASVGKPLQQCFMKRPSENDAYPTSSSIWSMMACRLWLWSST